jgi:CRISPR-associated protein Cas1
VEGSGAAAYFAAWPALLDAAAWGFRGRAYHPPTDPLNALLSFGYALLLNDVTSALHRIGLDPAIGFLHTVEYGRPSLACDLEEEFRPVIVDSLVLSLVRQELLLPADFQTDADGGPAVALSDDARRFVIARYQERLGVRVRHPQWDQQLTYRQCLERQAEHLARWIVGREETYQPLLME